MSDDKVYHITIDLAGKLDGADHVVQALGQVSSKAVEAGEALRLGFSVDLVHRFVELLADVPEKLEEAIRKGMEFNTVMEGTASAIRASITALNESSPLVNGIGATTDEILKKIEDGADNAGQKIQDMLTAFKEITPVALQAQIPLSKWPDFFGEAATAGARMNLQISEISSNLRMLLEGHTGLRNLFAQNLGIDEKSLTAAKEQGQLMDYLEGKMEAWQGRVEGLTAAQNRFGNAIEKSLGQITQELFASLTKDADSLAEAIKKMDPKPLEDLAREAAAFLDVGVEMTKWATEHTAVLALLLRALGTMSAGLTAAATVAGGVWLKNLLLSSLGITRETAALTESTAAVGANAAARANLARVLGMQTVATAEATAAGAAGAGVGAAGAARGGAALAALGGPVGLTVAAGVLLSQLAMAYAEHQNARQDALGDVGQKNVETQQSLREQIAAMRTQDDIAAARKRAQEEVDKAQADVGQGSVSVSYQRGHRNPLVVDQELLSLQQNRLAIAQHILATINQQGEAMARAGVAADDLKKKLADRQALIDAQPATREALDKLNFDALPDDQKSAALKQQLAAMQSDLAKESAAAGDANNPLHDVDSAKADELRLRIAETDKALKDLTKSMEDANKEKEKLFGKQQGEIKDLMMDFQIAQARASGNEAAAKSLERQRDMQKEILDIVEKTGLSQQQAANYVYRMVALQDAADARSAAKGQSDSARSTGQSPAPRSRSQSGNSVQGLGADSGWTAHEQQPWQRPGWAKPGTDEGWTAIPQWGDGPPAWRSPSAVPVAPMVGRSLPPTSFTMPPTAPTANPAASSNPAAIGANVTTAAEAQTKAASEAGNKIAAAIDKVGAAHAARDEKIMTKLNDLAGQVREQRN